MHEPIDEGDETGGIGEDLVPFAEGLVGGQQHTAVLLIAARDHLEEQVSVAGVVGEIPYLVRAKHGWIGVAAQPAGTRSGLGIGRPPCVALLSLLSSRASCVHPLTPLLTESRMSLIYKLIEATICRNLLRRRTIVSIIEEEKLAENPPNIDTMHAESPAITGAAESGLETGAPPAS
jgi:hypothetical protein